MHMRDDFGANAMQVLAGLAMAGAGAYLFYNERRRQENKRDWVVILGALVMAIGVIYGFGVFFGSVILVDEILDMFK